GPRQEVHRELGQPRVEGEEVERFAAQRQDEGRCEDVEEEDAGGGQEKCCAPRADRGQDPQDRSSRRSEARRCHGGDYSPARTAEPRSPSSPSRGNQSGHFRVFVTAGAHVRSVQTAAIYLTRARVRRYTASSAAR